MAKTTRFPITVVLRILCFGPNVATLDMEVGSILFFSFDFFYSFRHKISYKLVSILCLGSTNVLKKPNSIFHKSGMIIVEIRVCLYKTVFFLIYSFIHY